MNDKIIRVRIAPSPTGDPHVGTAYIGLFDYVFAHQNDGKFVLRLEDTDRERYKESSAQAILDAMRWLGITPDEDPEKGGDYGPYIQSERTEIYRKYVDILVDAGFAYHCFCTKDRLTEMRSTQEANKENIKYDRYCLHNMSNEERIARAATGEPFVIRMKMPDEGITGWTDLVRDYVEFDNSLIDDQVLLKTDGYPTYHLANVVDDHLMEITHVIRAEEWISSTPKHLVLYDMFGWEKPCFAHLPLLRNADRSKISKRFNNTSLKWYKEEGFLPEALLNFLAQLGWSHPEEKEIFTVNELVEKFSFDRFNKSGPIFDMEKLRWVNGIYIRDMDINELYCKVKPFLVQAGLIDANISEDKDKFVREAVKLEQEKAKTLKDFPGLISFLLSDEYEFDDEAKHKWLSPAPVHVVPALTKLAEMIIGYEGELSCEEYEAVLRGAAEAIGVGAGKVIHPARVALSGRTKGPSLFHMMELLGKEKVLARINRMVEMI
ncbi:MAG: glutamate--tRNA ligase [bacterium]